MNHNRPALSVYSCATLTIQHSLSFVVGGVAVVVVVVAAVVVA